MRKKMIPMAICYDFDGTLSAGNMQEYSFMKALKTQKETFWKESKELARRQNADEISAYMQLMLQKCKERGVPYTKLVFQSYGRDIPLFHGVLTWFARINEYATEKGIALNHYIISSGLKEIIEGTVIAKHFKNIFASSFMYDQNNVAVWPAVVLNYTSKTQFLFRINKGCEDFSDNETINKYIPDSARPMPFSNMVYIGDGDTDVPCMKMVKMQGGHSIAVYNPKRKKALEKAKHLISDKRVDVILPADYSADKGIENFVKAIIDKLVSDSKLEQFSKSKDAEV